MVVYPKKSSSPPHLYIDDQKMEVVTTMKYLGDTFNNKGNNTHLIDDRKRRGTVAMIQIEVLIGEYPLGIHTVNVNLMLYKSLFIPSILFNAQAWSRLLDRDTKPLQVLQLKVLRKILKVPAFTTQFILIYVLGIRGAPY